MDKRKDECHIARKSKGGELTPLATIAALSPMQLHIPRYYRDSFLAACEMQQVSICKPMTATEFQGMISAAGLSGTSEKEL